jgi:dihydrofolate reductase
MAKLVYTCFASLDGFVEDARGGPDWYAPDEEVWNYLNDLERPIGTYLYGRGMYEAMLYWETAQVDPGMPQAAQREFIQLWQKADKIVFSRTLESVAMSKSRLVRAFDPESVRRLKTDASADASVGGATLAGEALRAGLVDELRIFTVPMLIGGRTRSLPTDFASTLELREVKTFTSGVVFLSYTIA